MRFDIMTLFPAMIRAVLDESIIGRAQKAGYITVEAHNILSQHNYHGKKRKNTVDAVAASLILEGYLAFIKR